MDKKRANAKYSDGNQTVEFSVSIFLWEEESVFYVYSPALDLTGYGLTKEEARESFETVLEEFVKYTHNKKTIFKELENLGWAVNKRRKRVVSPDFEDLLSENEHFRHLYKSKDLVRDSSNVNLQLA
ncbi:hypothetical protein [Winogradskyella flava]|uniref:hypothetical protein n=1 Tax=Winogradskyella flava TaxID=1884876 RepID=UPI00248F6EB9|nr:hypothetical protein [Winogradskyella flava]